MLPIYTQCNLNMNKYKLCNICFSLNIKVQYHWPYFYITKLTLIRLGLAGRESDFFCLSLSRDLLPCTCGILPLKWLGSAFLLYEHLLISETCFSLYKLKSPATQVPPTTQIWLEEGQSARPHGGGGGLVLYKVMTSREFIKPGFFCLVLTKGTFRREEAHWPCRRLLCCWCCWL